MRRMTAMHNVFVYGTLKRGQPNSHLMTPESPADGEATFLGTAETTHKFPLVIAGRFNIPYLLDAPGKGEHVEGEMFQVDDVMLKKLDTLERHPVHYQRDDITVESVEGSDDERVGKTTECWSYLLRNYKPELNSLPTIQSFDVNSLAKKYVPAKDRNAGGTEAQLQDVLVQQ